MRAGIDGGCWTNGRGYGRFLRELLRALTSTPRHEYVIFLDEAGYRDFPSLNGVRPVCVPTSQPVSEAAGASSRRSLPDLLRMSHAAAREKLDIFWFPSVYSYFPLLNRVPVLLGIHDTMADRFPALAFASSRQEKLWNWKVKLALKQADLVLSVSQYAARTVTEFLAVPPDKIRVVTEGPAAIFRPLDLPPAAAPFILSVGGLSPNKNLDTLLRSFAAVHVRRPDCSLVLVGDYQSDSFKSSYQQLRKLADSLQLGNAVRFTGFVDDAELARLYNTAALLAFPSLEEGFGLPAVEAMACGLPVVASNAHALAEVVGEAGVLVDPRDATGLAAAILSVLENPDRAANLRKRSLERVRRYSWQTAARQLEAAMEELRR